MDTSSKKRLLVSILIVNQLKSKSSNIVLQRTPVSESKKSNSTTLTNAELICDNCINRHIIEDRHRQAKAAHDEDVKMQIEQANRDRQRMIEEEEAEQRRKEKFRVEAVGHWEESKKLKAKQKEGRLVFNPEERKNEEAYKKSLQGKGYDEKKIKEILEKKRNQLRNDLNNQINERKALEEQARIEKESMPNTGLPIGYDYVNRFERFKDLTVNTWKEQLDEKARRALQEKNLAKELQQKYAKEMEDFMKNERARRENAEELRKARYREDMDKFKKEHDFKKQREKEERERELNVLAANRAMQKEEDARREEAVKARETAHLDDLKRQIEISKAKKV